MIHLELESDTDGLVLYSSYVLNQHIRPEGGLKQKKWTIQVSYLSESGSTSRFRICNMYVAMAEKKHFRVAKSGF